MSIAPLQRFERAVRAAAVRALAMLMPMPRMAGTPDWSARPFRVLYLRYNAIGDMIMASGVIRGIATAHSTLTVDVLSSPANAPVLEGIPFVREVISLDRRKISSYIRALTRIRRSRYDVVVDGMAATPKPVSALIMLAARAPYRVGISERPTHLYTLAVQPKAAPEHHIEYMASLLEPFGVEPSSADLRPELSLTADERAWGERQWMAPTTGREVFRQSGRLLVNISAGRAWRRWPDERFEEVMRLLRTRHPKLAIVVIADLNEMGSAQRVAAAAGGTAVRASIREAFALVGTADLVLTPDTSISHAAAALRTPAVVMIPRHIRDFVPYRLSGRNVFSNTGDVHSIGVDAVVAALESAIAEFVTTPARAAT